jgi:hypothetical protein
MLYIYRYMEAEIEQPPLAPEHNRHRFKIPGKMLADPASSNITRFVSLLGWNRSSYFLISALVLVLLMLGYVWWPLADEYISYIDWDGEWWRYIDWLLIGIFLFMSLMVMAHANVKADARIVLVGLIGGLVIESWGTQTEIWTYYTDERPPLWIIPAWPIASLTIDRMVRVLNSNLPQTISGGYHSKTGAHSLSGLYKAAYWLIFPVFFVLMLAFTGPTIHQPFTIFALLLVAFIVLTPTDPRVAVLTFAAGAGLGYFLELWGTTRECWTYYTEQTPPLFAVLAHGMAAVAFWRCARVVNKLSDHFLRPVSQRGPA